MPKLTRTHQEMR